MTNRPDFDALRRRRDDAISRVIDAVCAEHGLDRTTVQCHVSPSGCYCACPDGPCEHEFAGWREFDDGCGGEQVCRLCGMGAMAHSLRTAE